MNVTGVSFGFESGSESILQSLKGDTVSIIKAKKAIAPIVKNEFVPDIFFLFLINLLLLYSTSMPLVRQW